MKTRWVISGSVFLALMAVLFILLTPPLFRHNDAPTAIMVFGGLTDMFGKMQAKFWTTNGSLEAFPQVTEISRRIGGTWTNEAPFLLPVSFHPFGTNFTIVERPHEARLLYVRVRDPSSPLRVVMRYRQRSRLGLRERLETYWVRRTKKLSVMSLRGRSYFLTNEIPASSLTNSDEADLIRALLRTSGADSTNNVSTAELLRVWSSPGIAVQERAQVVKSYFTIGTPVSDVVAKLGSNYTISIPFRAPPPAPGRGSVGLLYSFGEEGVIISTTAFDERAVLSSRFVGTGYRRKVTTPGMSGPNGPDAGPNPTAR